MLSEDKFIPNLGKQLLKDLCQLFIELFALGQFWLTFSYTFYNSFKNNGKRTFPFLSVGFTYVFVKCSKKRLILFNNLCGA